MTGGYPPGAANDSRAPYNQPSVEQLYHDSSTEVEIWFDYGLNSINQIIDYQWTQVDADGIEVWVQRPVLQFTPDDFIEDFTQTILPQFRGLKIYSIHLL